MVRVPMWAAGILGVLVLLAIFSGDAKITTTSGCDEWVREIAIRDIYDGYAPQTQYSFYGLGIGICMLGG